MNTNSPLFRHALYYGVALGITLSVFELIAFLLGIITKPIMGLINIALIVSMLIIAIRKFRDQVQNGLISFGNAFVIGLLTCLISGAIWSLYRFIEYSLSPGVIEEILLVIEEKLLESSMGEDQIESSALNRHFRVPFGYTASKR